MKKTLLTLILAAAMPAAALAQSEGLVEKAQSGDPAAMFELAEDLRWSNESEAVKWYKKAVEAGNGEAAATLGDAYKWGNFGLPEDESEAVKWYTKGESIGSGACAYELAEAYRWGNLGLSEDVKEALKHYNKGCELKDPRAMSSLAYLYLEEDTDWNDNGVKQDLAQAFKLLKGACDIYVSPDCEYNDGNACYALATLYRDGRGCSRNAAEAIKWLKAAVEANSSDAEAALKWIEMK